VTGGQAGRLNEYQGGSQGKDADMLLDNKGPILRPGEGTWLPVSPHQVRVVYREAGSTYSLVEWVAPPAVPGPPAHIHQVTDEAFFVLDGRFGFLVGNDTVDGPPGAFVRGPKGVIHTYWNQGATPARLLIVISPPGFEGYFEELSEGLAAAGDSQEESMSVRQRLSAKYDIEVVGPPRHAEG
jgi:mannose-6-phosphate isomerase-like protein (cupin superfamily)